MAPWFLLIEYPREGMAVTGSKEGAMKGSIGFVKSILEKLQSRLSQPPRGQKVGHFVVVATGGWRQMRFVVGLESLNDPEFLKLLKQAEDEFGFSQAGALAIPCEPDAILRIVGERNCISI